MGETASVSPARLSAAELLAMLGFAFFFGWMTLTFFWLLGSAAPVIGSGEADLGQLFLFAGLAAGYVALGLLGRRGSFNVFAAGVWTAQLLLAAALPVAVALFRAGMAVPTPLLDVLGLAAGLATATGTVQWLDVTARLKTASPGRFVGVALLGGCALMALAAPMPSELQPLLGLVFLAGSLALMLFSSSQAPGNATCAPLESTADCWQFTKEIEPTFFVLNVVFALTFALLFNHGPQSVFFGVASVGLGAAATAVVYSTRLQFSVITVERILLVITVLSCVMTPLAQGVVQLALACLVTAAWGMFVTTNYSYIVKKSAATGQAPTFRQAPARLAVPAAGFACGWALAALITLALGAHADAFVNLRSAMAVVLVIVFMAFFPSEAHHRPDGTATPEPTARVVPVAMDAHRLFDLRCDAVARLYQLSPRESDILRFLAKGRNASWIQEELTISPHTVKSHIYNIYRKLDIHSQQKLMDFVESFPLEEDDL